MIFQLIYTCAFPRFMTCEDLEEIAFTSRKRNFEFGITGLLLCNEGSVLQVLEGERENVLRLYERISIDMRISHPIVLIKRVAAAREFPQWSMGFKNASESEAIFELCSQTFPNVLPLKVSPEVSAIGQTFARINGLA